MRIRKRGGDATDEPAPNAPRGATGKVASLIFEGFLCEADDGEYTFLSREKQSECPAERAWGERLRITAWLISDEPKRLLKIVVRESAPFSQ